MTTRSNVYMQIGAIEQSMLPMLYCDVLSQMLLRATIDGINIAPKYVLSMKENINTGTFELLCTIHIWPILSKSCAKTKFTFSVRPQMQSQSMLKPPEKHRNFLQTLGQILLVCRKYLHPCLLSEIQKGKKKSKNEFDDSDINYDDYHHNDASLMMIVLTMIWPKAVMIQLFRA